MKIWLGWVFECFVDDIVVLELGFGVYLSHFIEESVLFVDYVGGNGFRWGCWSLFLGEVHAHFCEFVVIVVADWMDIVLIIKNDSQTIFIAISVKTINNSQPRLQLILSAHFPTDLSIDELYQWKIEPLSIIIMLIE